MATFGEAIKLYWSQYANFSGRSSRSEYWWAVLFISLVSFALGFIDGLTSGGSNSINLWKILTWLWCLACCIPGLALSVRRMHDIGKGGGWIFISFIPIVGSIWYLVLACTAGEPYENRFGVPYEDELKY